MRFAVIMFLGFLARVGAVLSYPLTWVGCEYPFVRLWWEAMYLEDAATREWYGDD